MALWGTQLRAKLAALAAVAFLSAPLWANPSLFPDDLPEAERVAVLRTHFDPPIGDMLVIDRRDLIEWGKKRPLSVRGFIAIRPPRGRCYVIRKRDDLPDEKICRETSLAFQAQDLEADGSLTWTVVTGDGDFGTRITWPSPYRVARTVPTGAKLASLTAPKLLIQCHVRPRTRIIDLDFSDGDKWRVELPEKDRLVDPSQNPFPNLFIQANKKKGALDGAAAANAKDPPSKEGEEATQDKGGKDASKASVAMFPSPEPEQRWSVPVRGSFVMASGGFRTSPVPAGGQGTCRYRFSDALNDRGSGVIECQRTGDYDFVYVHLPCITALKSKDSQ